jgi:hypothetical protein
MRVDSLPHQLADLRHRAEETERLQQEEAAARKKAEDEPEDMRRDIAVLKSMLASAPDSGQNDEKGAVPRSP